MEEQGEYLTIAEVATLLGVHRNTVRNRVKAGRYKARKVVTPQGETYAIARDSLGDPSQYPTNGDAQPLPRPVHHNRDNPSQPGALVRPEQQAQADAIVQRLLAPFIAELGEVREQLGKVKAERDGQAETIDNLRRQLAEAQSAPPAAPPPASAAPTPSAHDDTPVAPAPAGGFRAWLRRAFGGEG